MPIACRLSSISFGCALLTTLTAKVGDTQKLSALYGSLIRRLDFDLTVLVLAYHEERLSRLAEFAGMERALIENVIRMPKT